MMKVNYKSSSGKRIWALNSRYFFLIDKVEKVNVQIKYYTTDEMWGYFMTNPTQLSAFRTFRNYILVGNE